MLPRHTKETVIISVNIVKYFATIVNKRNETRYLKHILGCMKILNYATIPNNWIAGTRDKINKNKLEQGIFVFLGLIDLEIKAKKNRPQRQII